MFSVYKQMFVNK